MLEHLEPGWRTILQDFIAEQPQVEQDRINNRLNDLWTFLETEHREGRAYHPTEQEIFGAFYATLFDRVRVVIIGQDPYPDPDNVTGLAFSAPRDRCMPLSVARIYCALSADIRGYPPTHGNLGYWAEQGILLLNSALTIPSDNGNNTHQDKGWEAFMEVVIKALVNSRRPIHFILWGYKAQRLGWHLTRLNVPDSRIHKTRHPTARSPQHVREFLTCHHFSAVNEQIRLGNGTGQEINWYPPAQ